MAFSIYEAYVPIAQRSLCTFRDLLNKAEASPKGKDLLQARIHEDMLPLTKQVEYTCFFAFLIAADCMGEAAPQTYDPTMESFDAAHALLQQAEDALAKIDKEVTDKRAEEPAPLLIHATMASYPVLLKEKMVGWSIPQLLFHLSTGYNILRAQGIPLGKMVYIYQFMLPHEDFLAGLGPKP